jgi:hypothetical protein
MWQCGIVVDRRSQCFQKVAATAINVRGFDWFHDHMHAAGIGA